jgi:hypothetical protein
VLVVLVHLQTLPVEQVVRIQFSQALHLLVAVEAETVTPTQLKQVVLVVLVEHKLLLKAVKPELAVKVLQVVMVLLQTQVVAVVRLKLEIQMDNAKVETAFHQASQVVR